MLGAITDFAIELCCACFLPIGVGGDSMIAGSGTMARCWGRVRVRHSCFETGELVKFLRSAVVGNIAGVADGAIQGGW